MHTLEQNGVTWVDLVNPEFEELRKMQRTYNFHELAIEDILSAHERPKVDEYENYLFIELHVPYKDNGSGRFLKGEVNIFVGREFLITIHDGKLTALGDLWKNLLQSLEDREKMFSSGSGYLLYELTQRLFQSVFPLVDEVIKERRSIEDTLFETEDQENMLRAIMTVKRKIIFLRSLLIPQRTVLASLEHKYSKFSPSEELRVYFESVNDGIEHEILILETAREVVDALEDTHAGWISHQTSNIIRVLTIFSVVLLPLTLVTGLYGMNVDLPHDTDPQVFLWIVSGMLLFIACAFSYAWKKRWL